MKPLRTIATALLSCLLFQCAPPAPEQAIVDVETAPRGALVGSPDPALLALLARNRTLGAHVGAVGPASRK